MTLHHHPLEQLADRAGKLYTLPAVAMEVIRLTDHPEVDLQALKQCIENDPALTAKILRVVNSSLFGLSCEVSSLGQALALLGIKPLKLLVLGFSLPDALFRETSDDVLHHYWRRSLTKAVAAREIGESLFHCFSEEVFIAGLLEDLGQLALVQQLGTPYVEFLRKVGAEHASLPAMERESLGFEHRELTARLLDKWGLPHALGDAIARPRDLHALAALAPRAGTLPQILHLAELLASYFDTGRSEQLERLIFAAKTYRGSSRFRITQLLDTIQPRVIQLAEALRIELPSDFDFQAIVAEAHQQLAEVASDSAPLVARFVRANGSFLPPQMEPDQRLQRETRRLREALGNILKPVPECKQPAVQVEEQATASAVVEDSRFLVQTTDSASTAESHATPCGSQVAELVDPYAAIASPLEAMLADCRERRVPLTLVLWELDRADELRRRFGQERLARLGEWLKQMCDESETPAATYAELADGRTVWLLADTDRGSAVPLTRTIQETARRFTPRLLADDETATLSAGIATVTVAPRNFDPALLTAAAERCLYAAGRSGDSVKSIDVL